MPQVTLRSRMGAGCAASIALCLATIASAFAPYSDQPRFESRNGHLLIVGASGANISLQTSRGGQININDENLFRVMEMARDAAHKVDRWENEGAGGDADTRSFVSFLTPLTRRLEIVETLIANGSSSLNSRGNPLALLMNVRRLNTRVTRLARGLRSLRELVQANECASGPCLHGGTCQDLFNNYNCICPAQWEGNICQKDVDECEEFQNTGLGCQNGATCQNLPGSYNCICPPGWYGLHCTKKTKDCKAGSSSICGNGVCIDTSTGVVCQCDQGWTNDKATGACTVDIDECAANAHPCSHDPLVKCENLPGSFKCGACPIGYVGNGYQCRDIDECLTNNGGCSTNPMVQCINTRGSRYCGTCPPGYSGDGVSCSRVDDLCQVNRGGCHPLAQCIQNPGLTYVQCRCPPGWVGSGVGENGCVRDNRTSSQLCPLSYCLNGGSCHGSSDQNFYCICPPSFTGPRCEIGDRACASQPCKNNGTCVVIPGVYQSYKCLCSFGFTGENCQHSILGCGGTIRGAEGNLSWPPLNATDLSAPSVALECRWTIIAPNATLVLNITVDYNISCSLNFLRIHDGHNSLSPATRFCGYMKSSNYTSTRNVVQLVYEYTSTYRSDVTRMRQFFLKWTSVPRVCGGVVDVTTHGQISSPGSPGHYPNFASCKWSLSAQPGKRIQFTFFSMDIESHSSCKFDFLKIFDGPEITNTPLAVFCNKTVPPPVTTSLPEATIQFQTDDYVTGTGFQLTYIPVEGIPGCGGLLNTPFGRILPPQSHKVDGAYADNLLCEWKIQMSGRDKIKLEVKNFKLEWSNGCTYDKLEVYDGPNTDSRLIGRWCGDSGPEPLMSSRNSLTVIFKSDASYNEGSFVIDYSIVCDIEFGELNGTVTSPLYPNHYPEDRECRFLISLPVGYSVNLQMLDVDMEHRVTVFTDDDIEEERCLYDSLTIYDGDTTSSKVLSELCGNGTVGNIMSSHNYMLLVFKTDVSGGGRGFAANYSSTLINCGGIYRAESGTIKSPTEAQPNLKCRWIISAPVGKVIELGWSSFLLERSMMCMRGNVEIYENNTDTAKAHHLGETYCGDKVPPTMTSTSNILMIVLTTSNYASADPRFTAFYRIRSVDEACSGNFFSLNGAIQSPKYPEEYPNGLNCVWTITVPTGKQVSLHFKDFLLEGRSPCRSDYLEIRNGGYSTSPLIGKYCGSSITDDITSFGNQLYIRFFTDAAISSKGFSLTWDGTLSGCGGEVNGYSGSIISPNYPSPYGRNAWCTWRITVSHGSLVALTIVDIDLETHSTCLLDYLQVRDGASPRSPILGRYCSSGHPLTITSTGNIMYLQFRSDISREGRGFHLKFSTVCNRTIKGYRGVIESPEFPSAFTLPIDCTWTVEAPMGNKFTVVFSHLMIVSNKLYASFCSHSNRNSPMCKRLNNCDSYLQIDEGTPTNGRTLGKYCGSQSLPNVNSTFNEIKIHMKHLGGYPEVLFRLEWFVVGCGGVLKGKRYGELSTPDYPDIFSRPLVCEWTIIVDLGSRIRMIVSDFLVDKPNDCDQNSIQVFGGPDSTAARIVRLCNSQDSSSQLEVQTSGNHAFVRLQVQQANKHFKFKATYDLVDSKCGGYFSAPEGVFHSKNYPKNYDSLDDCVYEISIAETHRINLTLVDFDIDSYDNCSTSYLKVFDGEMESDFSNNSVRTLCGTVIPQPIISSTNKLSLRFSAGQRVAKGFMAKYSMICGTVINVTDDGVLSYTEYYDKPSSKNCSWILRSDTLGKTITLTFTKLDIRHSAQERSSSPNDSRLVIYGGDESLPLMTLSGDLMPPSLEVPGGSATIQLYTSPNVHVSFAVQYSIVDNVCGGTLEADSGKLASPKYPNDYPPNVECVWTILNSPGNTLILQFDDMQIQTSDSCNENYLEVRQTNEGGRLVGAYCGQTLPPRITTNSSLWIKFKSSAGVDKGFKASYAIGYFNDFTGLLGEISSPRYPSASVRKDDYKWRITTAPRSLIDVSFTEIYFEGGSNCIDKLTLFDGYDETAQVLKVLCGLRDSSTLLNVQTSSNVVFIVFHALAYPARFSLSWKEFSKTKRLPSKGSSVNCTELINIPLDTHAEFTSPGFPHGYGRNLQCEWVLATDPQNHIDISFSTIDLERYPRCFADKIEVFDGVSDGSWKSLATICHPKDTEREFSGTNLMKVKFSTDSFNNKTGFSAKAHSVCGGTLTDPDGVIFLNRTDYIDTPCSWNITVKPGKRIEITFGSFSFPVPPSSTACSSNYLILRDGFEDDAPFVGSGKFCDKIPPSKTMITSGNRLAVVSSESGYAAVKQQMELRYITKSRTCTSNVHLNPKSLRSMIIRSPNYPNMPPPHSECTWQFFAPNYETIHIEFLDRFDLAYSTDCEQEYLELRDGSTELSPLLGRYCYSTPPAFVLTEGNALFIKYFTDKQYPNNGFKAKVSLSDCGGTFHDFYSENIATPGYPASYEPNVNCVWRLINTNTDTFRFKVRQFNLGLSRAAFLQASQTCNAETMDTLNITVVNKADQESSQSWLVCGQNFTAPEKVTGSELVLNFTAVSSRYSKQRGLSEVGFDLSLTAEKLDCGGFINLPSGEIKTPGYPVGIRSTFCSWKITVPQGRRITFNLSDFDMGTSVGSFYSPHVLIYNDFRFQCELAHWNGSLPAGTSVSSSGNKMLIYFSTVHPSQNRGFRGLYSSELPSLCVADGLDQPTGLIRVDIQQPFVCEWEVLSKESNQTTTTFTVVGTVDQQKVDSLHCYRAEASIEFNLDNTVLLEFCSMAESTSPFVVVSPFSSTAIRVTSDSVKTKANYTISWVRRSCGGVFDLEGEMTITNPTVSGRYQPNYDCAWKIAFPEETTIKVKFNYLDLDMTGSTVTDCSSDYLSIHNGPSPQSPLISKSCGTIVPADLLTLSNNLWVHFHSDSSNEAKGFSITLSPAEEACGGILHENTGTIMSVNYPNQYANNSNCNFEIRVDKGYHIGLTFIDRFYIEDSPGCVKDYVEVFNFDEALEEWKSLGRVCGRSTPKVFNSTSNRMRIHFKSDDSVEGDGFKASWNVNCGGVFDGSKPGVIHSPHYPKDYDGDLSCNYTVTVKDASQVIYGSFETFDLEPRTSQGCAYDYIDIWYYTNRIPASLKHAPTFLGKYCGSDPPSRFLSFGTFKMSFITDRFTDFKGFLLNYGLDECGGNITQPAVIRSMDISQKMMNAPLNCTWRITAPKNQIVVIKIQELNITPSRGCSFGKARIWDGATIFPNNTNLMAILCGVLTDRSGMYRTSSESAIINFNTPSYMNNRKFVALITFAPGPKGGCGGRVILQETGETVLWNLSPPSPGGAYPMSVECVWTVSAPSSMTVVATFSKPTGSSCPRGNKTDIVELYDGIGENSEIIGGFNCSTVPAIITTSRSFLTIKFSTEGGATGFSTTLKALKSPCGIRLLSVTDSEQTLTSPSYPNNYPANIHCSWVLSSSTSFYLRIEEIDIVQSPGCVNDSLKIRDIEMGFPFASRFLSNGGETNVYIGNSRLSNIKAPIHMGSRYPFSTSIFCGVRKGVDYYSSGDIVMVKFFSSSTQTSKGFKLTYSTAGCNRNFTSDQGRIKVTNQRKPCVMHVIAPDADSTISLYFSQLRVYNWLARDSGKQVIKITDGMDTDQASKTLLAIKNGDMRTPEPVFSNSSSLTISIHPSVSPISFDITYTTTTQGRGCGGTIFNYGGIFTSPLYPKNVRNFTACRWDVAVPVGGAIELEFMTFELGPKQTCKTDFLQIYDVDPETSSEVLRRTYCGGDTPAKYTGVKGRIAVRYVTSIHNGGTGWVARFMSRSTDPSWPALVGQHLIA